jgi:Fe-S cluster biosynthesis and repair protein YggX
MKKKEFLKRATAKNVKQMRGHDAPSYEWNIYFDGKKICNCWDDSYGGELDITNYPNQSIQKIYESIEEKSLFDKEFKWTTSLELLMEEVKMISLMKKDEKKGVMVGKPHSYSIHGFKTSIPTTFDKWSKDGVLKDYQNIINDAIKKGQTILNAEYLRTWDLKINI